MHSFRTPLRVALVCVLAPISAGATPPNAHATRHHAAASPRSSASPSPTPSPSPARSNDPRRVEDFAPGRIVRFDVVGDDRGDVAIFVTQIRGLVAAMPGFALLAPIAETSAAPIGPVAGGILRRAADQGASGMHVGTVISGDHRTTLTIRPPRPLVDTGGTYDARADNPYGALSMNLALELSDHEVGFAPSRTAPRADMRHTVEFVLASTGRSLFPRTEVREAVERVVAPRRCEVVWR